MFSSKRDGGSICLLCFCCAMAVAAGDNKARIYEDAPSGTPLTFDKDLYEHLLLYRSCFGQLQQDESPQANVIEFDSERWELLLAAPLSLPVGSSFRVVVRLLCADNLVKSFDIYVSVSRRNTFTPEFAQDAYAFFVPASMSVGMEVGRVHAKDKDSIVYNAQFSMDLFSESGADRLFNLFPNGSIVMQHQNLSAFPVYERIKLTAVACDFGSPKLCSDVEINVTPVTVTAARSVQVNMATDEYQIFEWLPPSFGQPASYRVVIAIEENDERVVERRMNATNLSNRLMIQTRLNLLTNYTLRIYSTSIKGETPSDKLYFQVVANTFNCGGECGDGGRPACFYASPGSIEPQQYWDNTGPRCICYDGYFGHMCHQIDSCPQQTISEAIGRMGWNETSVNDTARIACPYGPAGHTLHRRCSWDRDEERPVWETPMAIDVVSCRKKNTLLTHMGVLNNYVDKAKSVSAMETLVQFLEPVLGSAAIDMDIGRHMIGIIDNAMSRNWSELTGNATDVRARFPVLMTTYATLLEQETVIGRVHNLSSKGNGVHLVATRWDEQMSNRTLFVGPHCFVVLPLPHTYSTNDNSQSFFGIWMRNATFYQNTESAFPVLEMTLYPRDDTTLTEPIVFGLRATSQTDKNLTCVGFDEKDQLWSQEGVRTVTQNDSNGFTVCETMHLSSFTVMPEADAVLEQPGILFGSDWIDWLPFLSSVFVATCCLALLFCGAISSICCRRPFKLSSIALLLIVTLLNTTFAVGSIWTSFLAIERPCWLLSLFIRFAAVATVMLLSVLAATLHSQVGRMRLLSQPLPTPRSDLKSSYTSVRYCNAIAVVLPAVLVGIAFALKETAFSPASHKECLPIASNKSIFIALFIGPTLITALVALMLLLDTIKQSLIVRRKQPANATSQKLLPSAFRQTAFCALVATAAFILVWVGRVSESCGIDSPPTIVFCCGQVVFAFCLVLFVCAADKISHIVSQISLQRQQQHSGRNSATNSLERRREGSLRRRSDGGKDSPIRLISSTPLLDASESTLSNSTTKEPLLNEHSRDPTDAPTNNNNNRFAPIVSVV